MILVAFFILITLSNGDNYKFRSSHLYVRLRYKKLDRRIVHCVRLINYPDPKTLPRPRTFRWKDRGSRGRKTVNDEGTKGLKIWAQTLEELRMRFEDGP